MNGIAEPLFGKQQDGLVLQRLVAKPERRAGETPLPGADEFLPAPFILTPAALEVAKPQAHQALIVMRLRALRIDRNRGREALERLFMPIERDQGRAFVDVQFGNARCGDKRALVTRRAPPPGD